jgi:hypothetical protein
MAGHFKAFSIQHSAFSNQQSAFSIRPRQFTAKDAKSAKKNKTEVILFPWRSLRPLRFMFRLIADC